MEKKKFDPLKTVSIVIIVVWELIIYNFSSDQPMFLGLWVFFFISTSLSHYVANFFPIKTRPPLMHQKLRLSNVMAELSSIKHYSYFAT